ncbi:MAG: ECF-type sigma factor [Planctomycetota bacterium]
MTARHDVTQALNEFNSGDKSALDRLLPIVYLELKSIASRQLGGEGNANTLQPTMLVHDAYFKLVGADLPEFKGRAHFFGVAARAIRQVLVSHARQRNREKRGGGRKCVTFHEEILASPDRTYDILDFESALLDLASQDEIHARIIELRFFGGLEVAEIAEIMETSKSSIERGLRSARAFLASRLTAQP